MRTEDLVDALVADAATPVRPLRRDIGLALAVGSALAILHFTLTLGARPTFAASLGDWRFLLKFIVTGTLAAGALALLLPLSRPTGRTGRTALLLLVVPPMLVLAAAVIDLAVNPQSIWMTRAIGQNSMICLRAVPALALGPLVALLIALRRAAPGSPALAGAVAGLAAGAIGALLYAAHCPDDSPLFVAIWYTLAISIVTGAGALAGRLLLRW